jgi:RNA polymerase sigma factor (TIGR02999 family)
MARERKSHSWAPSDLVHNLYARLRGKIANVTDQEHFLRLSAEAMRHILIDHARQKKAKSHGGDLTRVPFDEVLESFEEAIARNIQVKARAEAVSDALDQLKKTHLRAYKVIHLRFFSNNTKAETAQILGVSPGTVDNDWVVGRARLRLLLQETDDHAGQDESAHRG